MHKIENDKPKYNAANERVKEKYFRMLNNAGQMGAKTIRIVSNAILRFEDFTGFRDFRKFQIGDAEGFKEYLNKAPGRWRGHLSVGAKVAMLTHLWRFFEWLSRERGYRRHVDTNEAKYFKPLRADVRESKAATVKDSPTMEEILSAVMHMPTTSEIELRDRAIVALTILSGLRDDALVSLKLRHIRLERELIVQDPKTGVRTKNRKGILTYFFPVDPEFKSIVTDWVQYMMQRHGPEHPLFPRTKMTNDAETTTYVTAGLDDKHWTNTVAVRKIFRAAFEGANLRYYKPHLFRDTLTQHMLKTCRTFEEMKAWSQNIGHKSLDTTLGVYGTIPPERQGVLLKGLGMIKPNDGENDRNIDEVIAKLAAMKRTN